MNKEVSQTKRKPETSVKASPKLKSKTTCEIAYNCGRCTIMDITSCEKGDKNKRWVSEADHRKGLAEKDKQIKEIQEEFNSYCAKTQANCNHCAVKHTEKIEVLEGRLEAIRKYVDALAKYEDLHVSAETIATELGVLLSTFLPKKLDQKMGEAETK